MYPLFLMPVYSLVRGIIRTGQKVSLLERSALVCNYFVKFPATGGGTWGAGQARERVADLMGNFNRLTASMFHLFFRTVE